MNRYPKEFNKGPKKLFGGPSPRRRGEGREWQEASPLGRIVGGQGVLPGRRAFRENRKSGAKYLSQMAVRHSQEAPISLKDFMGELEKEVILQVLNHVDGKQTDAARILGMKHTTLHQKIRRYGIRITRVSRV